MSVTQEGLWTWAPSGDPVVLARLGAELAAAGVPVELDRPLAALTTFGVGGPAALLANPQDAAQLARLARAVIGVASHEVPILVLGRGSNLLISDRGFRGLVVRLGRGFNGVGRDGTEVLAGAAVAMPRLAAWTAEQGLSGLEYGAAIPGSVGGAVRMNAGAHGRDVRAALVSAEVTFLGAGEPGPRVIPAGELKLGYRRSELPAGAVVTAARWRCARGDPERIRAELADLRAWRRRAQPIRERSCGSVFTNPPGDSAGRLVELAGGKGRCVGGARVSDKHANFIVVDPGSQAADVAALIGEVQHLVAAAGGPWLVPEVRLVGEFPGLARS